MYGNYNNMFSQQANLDKINSQINELERIRNQIQSNSMQNTTPSINQTFQLAPNNGSNGMKFVNSIEDVNKELVFNDTPFFNKELSVVWIKNAKGEVKVYSMNEIIQKDEKDIKIDYLMAQIEELKKGRANGYEPSVTNVNEPIKSEKPTNVSNGRTSKAKSK